MIEEMRKIYLFNNEKNNDFPDNKIKTTKYNIITFLPLSIIYQFTNYSNIYFLLVAIILAIKEISPQDPTVALIPFIFVIVIGVLVEAFDEFKKWRNDDAFNNSPSIRKNQSSGNEENVIWASLKVGNIIKVVKNETIPADILIIKTSSLNHFCYMQTTNLDGESALKPRELIPMLQNKFDMIPMNVALLDEGILEVEQPSANIYKCNGSITMKTAEKSFITIDNILLRGTTLKNVEYVYGIIIYTGKDTKIMKNIQPSSLKSSSIEDLINKVLIGVIIFVFLLCLACTVFGMIFLSTHVPDYENKNYNYDYLYYYKGNSYAFILEFFKLFGAFFILFNNIIPISLAITFTIAKVIQILIIEHDPGLKEDPNDQLKVLSSRLQEDLGKIQYIFTDKTGTLTRNEMVFKGCSILGQLYYDEQVIRREDELISALKEGKEDTGSKLGIPIEEKLAIALRNNLPLYFHNFEREETLRHMTTSRFISSQDTVMEFGLNIALNHNVLSEYDEVKEVKSFQGPNPDEVALVTMAKEIGIEFIERVGKLITVKINDTLNTFEVLQVFAYSSERKRSGIIIKNNQTNAIHLYIKGADDKIMGMCQSFSSNELISITKNHLDTFAKSGLRTLCYASKCIPIEEYNLWERDYTTIKTEALINSALNEEVEKKITEMEQNLLLIGVSGLEDRLQDEVKDDIEKFIEAGIQVWMITGDQLDTAESIGYSSNFFENDTEVFKIRSNSEKEDILQNMTQILEEITSMEQQLLQYKIDHNKTKKKPNLNNTINEVQTYRRNANSIIDDGYVCQTVNVCTNVNSVPLDSRTPFENHLRNRTERRPSACIPKASHRDFELETPSKDNSIDDVEVINFMLDKHMLGNTIEAQKEANTFIQYVADVAKLKEDMNNSHPSPKEHNAIITTDPEKLYLHYKSQIQLIEERKAAIGKYTKFTSLNFRREQEITHEAKELNLLNFGLVIEGNALMHCLSKEIQETFWKLIQKSRSIICCRCTPVQKANVVEFVKEKSQSVCLSIGDGGNDVNMIKKANVGVGIFGKEGHQAAYNSDYAIAQFKYLKQLMFYHGRYILNRNSYFIYFFFYKGLIFCFPCFWFGFFTGFSGSNFWDFVWFTMYTGLTSTMPPVVYMVFEEDIDVDFDNEPDQNMLKNLLPDIYREYRDSSPFNVMKYYIIFFLAIVHSFIFYFYGYFAFLYGITDSEGRQFGMWDYSLMCLLTVLIVQYVILFLDTNKFFLWVYLAHAVQIIVNILFGIFYALGNTDELGAYTFEVLSSGHFWLILFGSCHICLIPVYFSRYFEFLFSDSIINNLRNKRTQNHFAKKMYIKKIEHMTKCTRSLAKFKKIYNALDKYQADNFADRKMREIVQMYKIAKQNTNRKNIISDNNLGTLTNKTQPTQVNNFTKNKEYKGVLLAKTRNNEVPYQYKNNGKGNNNIVKYSNDQSHNRINSNTYTNAFGTETTPNGIIIMMKKSENNQSPRCQNFELPKVDNDSDNLSILK